MLTLYICLENVYNLLNEPLMMCWLKEELDYNALFNDKVYSMITTGETAELHIKLRIVYWTVHIVIFSCTNSKDFKEAIK